MVGEADKYSVERSSGNEASDAAQMREIMVAEGYSVFQWSDRPGASYGVHKHSTRQSHWIISGVLELDVAGFGIVELRPGDRDLMPANTGHSARVVGDEPVVYLIGEKP